ncbi:MAG: PilZ domain-containing protein [Novosphingobium sp.]
MASEPATGNSEERRSPRQTWEAEVHFRSGNRRANVRVSDISTLGARVHGVYLVREYDSFWIKLPGMESIEARVAWVEDFVFGCEFVRPLNDVVLEALLRS